MTAEEISKRLALARQRIQEELWDLADDLGDHLSVEVGIDWISVATHGNPYARVPNVRVHARILE